MLKSLEDAIKYRGLLFLEVFEAKNQEGILSLEVSDGFTWYSNWSLDSGVPPIKSFLVRRIADSAHVFLAIKDAMIVGFAVVIVWPKLPGCKMLEAIEVAKTFRGGGVGTKLMSAVVGNLDDLLILTALPEAGHEEDLLKFYRQFGFIVLTRSEVRPAIMARLPNDLEKLKTLMGSVEKSFEDYSYERFNTKSVLPIWGRRYAPWLNYDYDIFISLEKEIKSILDKIG